MSPTPENVLNRGGALLCLVIVTTLVERSLATNWAGIAQTLDPSNMSLSSWLQGTPCGNVNFQGVTCLEASPVAVDLSNLKLSGSIPADLTQIGTLTRLNLNNNSLYGAIPPTWNNLLSLQELSVCCNNLNGNLPDLGALTNMVTLDVSQNNFNGVLNPTLGNLVNLKSLKLDGNILDGEIPSTFTKLTGLTTLTLNDNQLKGTVPKGLNYLKWTPGAIYNFTSNAYGFCGTAGFVGIDQCPGVPIEPAPSSPPPADGALSPPADGTISPPSETPPDSVPESGGGSPSPVAPGESSPSPSPDSQTTPPASNASTSNSQGKSSGGNGMGMIIGAAGGGAAVLLLALCLIFCLCCRKGKKAKEVKPTSEASALVGASGKKSASFKSAKHAGGDIESGQAAGVAKVNGHGPAVVIAAPPATKSTSGKDAKLAKSSSKGNAGAASAAGSSSSAAGAVTAAGAAAAVGGVVVGAAVLAGGKGNEDKKQTSAGVNVPKNEVAAVNTSGSDAHVIVIPPVVPLPPLKSLSKKEAAEVTVEETEGLLGDTPGRSSEPKKESPAALPAYGAAGRAIRAGDVDLDEMSGNDDGLSELGLKAGTTVPGAGWAAVAASEASEASDDIGGGGLERWFTVSELALATNEFGRQGQRNVLGSGRYGTVYKARLPEGTTVAVKRLTNRNPDQSAREFKFEVEAMAHARHPNLVALLGCCAEGEERMLVYEYVPNGSLESWLHQNQASEPLDWQMRMHVAIGCARGLAQLHEGLEVKVVHRDVKSSNVLLDAQWNAKLGDFALAKIMGKDQGHATTRVVGTFGYVAPEYMNTGILTERSDVYSFGVLLLELVSGRKPVDNQASAEEVDLVKWVKKMAADECLADVVDVRLQGLVPIDDAEYVLGVALRCVETNALKRPKISQVVNMLESEDPTQKGDWVARRPSPLSARGVARESSPGSSLPYSRSQAQASPRAAFGRADSLRSSSPRHSVSGMSPHAPDYGAMITNAAMRSSPRHYSPTAPRNTSPTGMPVVGARASGNRPSSPRASSPTGDLSTGSLIASQAMSIGNQRKLGSWNRR